MGVSGNGDRELAALAVRLAGADKALRAAVVRRWRDAAGPAADAVRRSVLTAPAEYQRGLRQEIAATVHTEVRFSPKVQVSVISRGSEMPPGKTELPHHMDTGGWRHPVFQTLRNPGTWVSQASNRPGWFTLTNIGQQPAFARAAQQALDDAGREIQG